MNALRIVCLIVAVGVLGLLGWRAAATRGAAIPVPSGTAVALQRAMDKPATPVPVLLLPPPPVVPSSPPPQPAPPSPTPEGFADAPEFAPFYARLKADFPRDYDAVVAQLSGASSANAAIWEALRGLEQSKGILAAQAGSPVLDRFFDARSAMLDGMAPLNARQCVDFLYGLTDASIADFTAAHRGLVATLADRTLDAIADGRSRNPERIPPTGADLDALSAGLAARGLSPAEVGLLIDGTTPDPPIPDARLCEDGRAYLDVLHRLPLDVRQRIYGLAAELLARS